MLVVALTQTKSVSRNGGVWCIWCGRLPCKCDKCLSSHVPGHIIASEVGLVNAESGALVRRFAGHAGLCIHLCLLDACCVLAVPFVCLLC